MVKIGFALSVGSTIPWKTKLAFAEEVERLGYDSFWLPHFIARDVHAYDTWDSHSAIAARTSRIRLGTGVYQIPLCNPIELARRVMTVDHISGGRLIFGVGAGWIPREFEMMGVPYNERGRRADEILEIFRKLWTEEGELNYDGKYYKVKALVMEPKPIQTPLPILWGGGYWKPEKGWDPSAKQPGGRFIDSVIRRIARYCDGWLPDLDSVGEAELIEGMERIKAGAKEIGRRIDDQTFDLTCNSYGSINIDPDPKQAAQEAQRYYSVRVRKGYMQVQGAPPLDLLGKQGMFGPAEAVAERVATWLSWEKKVPAFKRVFIMFASLDPVEQLRRFHAQVAPLLKQ